MTNWTQSSKWRKGRRFPHICVLKALLILFSVATPHNKSVCEKLIAEVLAVPEFTYSSATVKRKQILMQVPRFSVLALFILILSMASVDTIIPYTSYKSGIYTWSWIMCIA